MEELSSKESCLKVHLLPTELPVTIDSPSTAAGQVVV